MTPRVNHSDEEPYRLFVTDRDAQVLNRFERKVAYVYLWGEGSSDAIWVLQTAYIWGNISHRLFGDIYTEQMRFMRREEALRHIEKRLGIKRTSIPPKHLTPAPGMTMWETEDAAAEAP